MQSISIESKKCFGCGVVKLLSDYHKSKVSKDGHKPQCKECRRRASRGFYDRNRETQLARQLAYNKENPEIRQKWLEENKEHTKEYNRNYNLENREVRTEKQKKFRKDNPDKYRARRILNNAINLGKVIPPEICSILNCNGKPQGHHEDYS